MTKAIHAAVPHPPNGHAPAGGVNNFHHVNGVKGENGYPLTARDKPSHNENQHKSWNHEGLQAPSGSLTAREPARANGDRQSTAQRSEQTSKSKEAPVPNAPMTPAAALKMYKGKMSLYEQGEILDYQEVYFVGPNAQKIQAKGSAEDNHGYDDERGDYQWVMHDHIAYRYEIIDILGKGSFGAVTKCYDWKTNQLTALKIIRNKKRFHNQAQVEVRLLRFLKEQDQDSTANVVHLSDHFIFRNHMCITFELLCINLYEFIKNNNFQGLSLNLIRRIAIQLLYSLRFLRRLRIIHCDLKPENILLKAPNKSSVKIIDFGSSCLESERVYSYIQSRFYRSPEVILGLPYGMPIDMWSFGCILAELYSGYPIFPGENEMEQLACIMEILGLPPRSMVEQATRKKTFFDQKGNPIIVANSRGKKRRPGSKDISMALRCNDTAFVSFLQGCLHWDKRERFTPDDALQHPWISEGGSSESQRQNPSSYGSRESRQSQQRTAKMGEKRQPHVGYLSNRDRSMFPPIDPSTQAANGVKPKAQATPR